MGDGWTYQLTFKGETFELSDAEQIAGRSRACDISVPDASVSRKHARLKPGPGHVLIQDLNSSNGTFINDRRVQGEDAAENGDSLRLGDAEMRVVIDQPAAYQTMRLPTGGLPEPALPGAAAHKAPGPATTMLAEESVRLAQQAEIDRLAREATEAGEAAASISVVPEEPPSEQPLPGPPEQAQQAAVPPVPPTAGGSQPSPLTTQRLDIPLPAKPSSAVSPPVPPARPPAEPAAPETPHPNRQVPWAQAAGDAPSPHQTQRFDSSSFAASPPAAPPPAAPESPPTSPPASEPFDPAATRRLEIPSPPADRTSPPQAPLPQAPPLAPAATVAMPQQQLDAARRDVVPVEEPAPDFAAGGSEVQGFELDEELGSSEVRPPDDFIPASGRAWQVEDQSEIQTEKQSEEPPQPLEPPPAPPANPPAPTPAQEPPSGPKFDRPVATWADKPPDDGDATFAEINYDSRSAVEPPDDGSWEPPDIAPNGASFESSWVPNSSRDAEADGGFSTPPAPAASPTPTPESPPQPVPAAPLPATPLPAAPRATSLRPEAPEPPTVPSMPSPPPSFDQPTPPAAPPPSEVPRKERVASGASGLLPSLDELDGAIAGPEMEMPYQPDPDPTASVPVASLRRDDVGVGFLLRALATVLDMLWISALTVAAWMVSDADQVVSFAVNGVCMLGIIVGWALWGTSPGKKALGLTVEGKVPEAESGGIGFLRAVIRAAGYLVSGLTLGIGFLMIAFSAEKRGLHDRIAGTWVRRRG